MRGAAPPLPACSCIGKHGARLGARLAGGGGQRLGGPVVCGAARQQRRHLRGHRRRIGSQLRPGGLAAQPHQHTVPAHRSRDRRAHRQGPRPHPVRAGRAPDGRCIALLLRPVRLHRPAGLLAAGGHRPGPVHARELGAGEPVLRAPSVAGKRPQPGGRHAGRIPLPARRDAAAGGVRTAWSAAAHRRTHDARAGHRGAAAARALDCGRRGAEAAAPTAQAARHRHAPRRQPRRAGVPQRGCQDEQGQLRGHGRFGRRPGLRGVPAGRRAQRASRGRGGHLRDAAAQPESRVPAHGADAAAHLHPVVAGHVDVVPEEALLLPAGSPLGLLQLRQLLPPPHAGGCGPGRRRLVPCGRLPAVGLLRGRPVGQALLGVALGQACPEPRGHHGPELRHAGRSPAGAAPPVGLHGATRRFHHGRLVRGQLRSPFFGDAGVRGRLGEPAHRCGLHHVPHGLRDTGEAGSHYIIPRHLGQLRRPLHHPWRRLRSPVRCLRGAQLVPGIAQVQVTSRGLLKNGAQNWDAKRPRQTVNRRCSSLCAHSSRLICPTRSWYNRI